MKKLKLESLEVASFETLPEPRERGTVQGHEPVFVDPSFGPKTDCGTTGDTDPFYCCTYGCTHESIREDCNMVLE